LLDKEYIDIQVSGSAWSYGSPWGDSIEAAIRETFKDIDREAHVLDVGCGEGRGLDALKDMGFINIIGVDLSDEKLAKAKERGHIVLNSDFHTLCEFEEGSIDYIFCSHTLEHALDLEVALKTLINVVRKVLFFIVPIGETKEEVEKYNPSHTSPIKDKEQLIKILDNIGYKYCLIEKYRHCSEIWGKIYK